MAGTEAWNLKPYLAKPLFPSRGLIDPARIARSTTRLSVISLIRTPSVANNQVAVKGKPRCPSVSLIRALAFKTLRIMSTKPIRPVVFV